jgi:ArsR family transcriptional regulator, zinc-responsive transcriptional repressor
MKKFEKPYLVEAAQCLKVMAHPARLFIVEKLGQGEMPVCHLAQALSLPHHQTSEHLRIMHARGYLSSRREGRKVFYKVAHPQLLTLIDCIHQHCNYEKEI